MLSMMAGIGALTFMFISFLVRKEDPYMFQITKNCLRLLVEYFLAMFILTVIAGIILGVLGFATVPLYTGIFIQGTSLLMVFLNFNRYYDYHRDEAGISGDLYKFNEKWCYGNIKEMDCDTARDYSLRISNHVSNIVN